MKRHGYLALWMAVLLGFGFAHAEAGEAEDAAVASAESWLALVDSGEYEESWSRAAELFRNAVSKEDWVHAAESVRGPLGSLRSRELKSATFTTSLPGAPDGEYVVIQFEASYANKREAIETVIPMKAPDGRWQVSGYFIK